MCVVIVSGRSSESLIRVVIDGPLGLSVAVREFEISAANLLRAHGGCLGIKRR